MFVLGGIAFFRRFKWQDLLLTCYCSLSVLQLVQSELWLLQRKRAVARKMPALVLIRRAKIGVITKRYFMSKDSKAWVFNGAPFGDENLKIFWKKAADDIQEKANTIKTDKYKTEARLVGKESE